MEKPSKRSAKSQPECVRRDFAHHIDLKAVLTTRKTILRHDLEARRLQDRPIENSLAVERARAEALARVAVGRLVLVVVPWRYPIVTSRSIARAFAAITAKALRNITPAS